MDALRGAAILVVVVYHVFTIPAVLGGVLPQWLPPMDIVLPFGLPAIFALSGMLLPRSLEKPISAFYAGKSRKILWPYVLWTVITSLVLLSPSTLTIPWTWIGGAWHLWFLAVLLACYLVAPLTRWIPAWLWPVCLVPGLMALQS